MACNQGAHNGYAYTPQDLDEELKRIDVSEKEDYLKALAVAPDLVAQESDPDRFLRFTNGNKAAAARGIATYWKRRKDIFGEKLFLLPLILTGDGALTTKVVELIMTGKLAFPGVDNEGCTVVVSDPSRRLDEYADSRLQAMFYYSHIMSLNPLSQSKGVVHLILVKEPMFDRTSDEGLSLLVNTFPVRFKKWIFCDRVPRTSSSGLRNSFLDGIVGIFQKFLRKHASHIYTRKQDIVTSLISQGIPKEIIPICLGGTWSYEEMYKWIRNRQVMDRAQYAGKPPFTTDIVNAKLPVSGSKLYPIYHDDFLDTCRRNMKKALHKLPETDMEEYAEAIRLAADETLHEECNPDLFLEAENYHHWLAAQRHARYWQLRTLCFGQKRFQSVNQTGDDALRRQEIMVLQTGFVMLLRNDEEGCPIIFIDASPLRSYSYSKTSRNQCLFYMFSLLVENKMSPTKGAVLLYMDNTETSNMVELDFLGMLVHGLPLHFKAVHIICPPNTKKTPSIESHTAFAEDTYVHVASSRKGICQKLEAFGMPKAILPKALGGDWGYADYLRWKEIRTRIEWRVPLGLSGRGDNPVDLPAMKPYAVIEEKKERNRRLNALHSRRKRDRVRFERALVEEQVRDLEDENRALLNENSRLEGLVAHAMSTVAVVSGLLDLGSPTR